MTASASIGYGANTVPITGIPVARRGDKPGVFIIILGYLPSGSPVRLTVTSYEWLDDLEAASQHARTLATPALAAGGPTT